MYGNPETTTGGNALKFYASQRLEIRRGDKMEENKELIGFVTRVKVVKNKVAPPFKKAEIPVKFDQGYYKTGDIVECALAYGLITRAWAFYTVGTEKFQGKQRVVEFLDADLEWRSKLEKLIQTKIKEIRIGKADMPELQVEEKKAKKEEVKEEKNGAL